jgi:hypothetical protein
MRALKAPGSRHAILRFRFNHIKASIILDTFPKVMALAFPGVPYRMDKADWYAELGDDSQIWFGGWTTRSAPRRFSGRSTSRSTSTSAARSRSHRAIRQSPAWRSTSCRRSRGRTQAAQAPHVLRLQPAIQGALDLQALRPEDRPRHQEAARAIRTTTPASRSTRTTTPRTWPRATSKRWAPCRHGCRSASSRGVRGRHAQRPVPRRGHRPLARDRWRRAGHGADHRGRGPLRGWGRGQRGQRRHRDCGGWPGHGRQRLRARGLHRQGGAGDLGQRGNERLSTATTRTRSWAR